MELKFRYKILEMEPLILPRPSQILLRVYR